MTRVSSSYTYLGSNAKESRRKTVSNTLTLTQCAVCRIPLLDRTAAAVCTAAGSTGRKLNISSSNIDSIVRYMQLMLALRALLRPCDYYVNFHGNIDLQQQCSNNTGFDVDLLRSKY